MYLRIDTIEHGLKELCNIKAEVEGYHLGYRIVSDNLKVGISVVVDSCNPIKITRDEWEEIATSLGAAFKNIEIRCSDLAEHKARVEHRTTDIDNLHLPTWEQVISRYYEAWDRDVIVLETSGKPVTQSFSKLLEKLED